MKRSIYEILLGVLLAGAGCRSTGVEYAHPDADYAALHRVAVIPFQSQAVEPRAGEKVTDTFAIEMMARSPWQVVDLAQVAAALRAAQLEDPSRLSAADIQRLGAALGVEAIVCGSVDEYAMGTTPEATFPVVAVSVRLVDVATGSVLWAGQCAGNGRSVAPIISVGTVDTLPEMAQVICRELVCMMME